MSHMVSALELQLETIPAEPQTSWREITGPGGLDVGVWEHAVGISEDVEVDEVFVVISGRATIELAGGEALEVGPGDVGILTAGEKTRWTIHETLRKVYVIRC